MKILDPLFRCSAANALFSDDATLQRMLDFEAALAHASVDLLPDSTAAQITSAIASKCRVELFDKAKLAEATASAGNIAIPLINQLKAHVAVDNSEAANFVHLGATSQDLIDTAQILQVRDAFILIHADLRDLCSALATLTTRHRNTPIVGRTWMQHAVPTTLGMKFAGWLDALERHRQRLRETQTRCLVLQFGGAVAPLHPSASTATKSPNVWRPNWNSPHRKFPGTVIAIVPPRSPPPWACSPALSVKLPATFLSTCKRKSPKSWSAPKKAAAVPPPCRINAIPSRLPPSSPPLPAFPAWSAPCSAPWFTKTNAPWAPGTPSGKLFLKLSVSLPELCIA